MNDPRCLIADDHPALTSAVSAYLAENGFDIVGPGARRPPRGRARDRGDSPSSRSSTTACRASPALELVARAPRGVAGHPHRRLHGRRRRDARARRARGGRGRARPEGGAARRPRARARSRARRRLVPRPRAGAHGRQEQQADASASSTCSACSPRACSTRRSAAASASAPRRCARTCARRATGSVPRTRTQAVATALRLGLIA